MRKCTRMYLEFNFCNDSTNWSIVWWFYDAMHSLWNYIVIVKLLFVYALAQFITFTVPCRIDELNLFCSRAPLLLYTTDYWGRILVLMIWYDLWSENSWSSDLFSNLAFLDGWYLFRSLFNNDVTSDPYFCIPYLTYSYSPQPVAAMSQKFGFYLCREQKWKLSFLLRCCSFSDDVALVTCDIYIYTWISF